MFARIILKSGVSFVVEVEHIKHTDGAGIIPDRLQWKTPPGSFAKLEKLDLNQVAAIVTGEYAERLTVDPAPAPAPAATP